MGSRVGTFNKATVSVHYRGENLTMG